MTSPFGPANHDRILANFNVRIAAFDRRPTAVTSVGDRVFKPLAVASVDVNEQQLVKFSIGSLQSLQCGSGEFSMPGA